MADATPHPLELAAPGRWRQALAGLVSVGLLAAILWQLRGASGEALALLAGLPAAAWACFALAYLAQPAADYAIYAHLWKLPASGLAAVMRKTVINEVIVGYGGEVYLYLWARGRPAMATAPFGAVKDVTLLSALAGNLLTLAMLAWSAPRLAGLNLGQHLGPALWIGIGLAGLSLVVLVFGRRVFSLPGRTLAFVAGVHAVRLTAVTGLTVLIWRLALPGTSLATLADLMTLRLVVSRVPFVTNKELVFGNLVLLLMGREAPVAVLLAAMALAWLAAHLVVLTALGASDAWRSLGSAGQLSKSRPTAP